MYVNRTLVFSTAVVLASLAASVPATAEPTKQECLQANESAQELRRSGKLRDARARLAVCMAASCPGPVRDDCTERLNEIEKAQPTVVFDVKNAAGDDLSAVKVRMDDRLLAERLDGAALSVDPGEHRFVFESEGLPKIEKTLVIAEGVKGRRERILLGAVAAAGAAPARDGGEQTPTAAYVALGVGGVGLLVGVVSGILAFATKSGCASDGTCASQSDADRFGTERTIAIVGLSVGIVSGGIGAWLFFSKPKPQTASAQIIPWIGLGAAGIKGRF